MKNKVVFYSLFLSFTCFTFNVNAQFEKDKARSRTLQIDQTKLHATLSFFPKEGKVSGFVELDFKALDVTDSLWLDGIKIEVSDVRLDGEKISFKEYPKGIAVFPDFILEESASYQLSFWYDAYPKRGMYFLGWNDTTGLERKQIWTQGQGIDNRHWLPHVDAQNDKLSTELSILNLDSLEVISNGVLVNTENVGHQTLYHYEMKAPQSSYLMMVAMGDYAFIQGKSQNGTDLKNYFYPDWAYRNKWTYFKSTELFNWMEAEIRVPFPWQNYKQVPVKDFQHGAMENTTATIFGDFYCVDSISFNDDNYVGVNAHELAHQWFGNSVTALSSHDHWLHEGFATYYSWLAEREVFGEDRYNELLMAAEQHIISDNMQNEFPLHHSKAGSTKFYEQGAWFLHMLKVKIGQDAFRNAVKSYLENNAYKMVTTRDFQQVCETASGKELGNFFKQWIERPQMPTIDVTSDYETSESKFTLSLEQTQKINSRMPAYLLTVPVIIYTDIDTYTYDLKFGNQIKNLTLILNPNEKVKYIEVDPNATLLANWIFYFPNEWVFNQMKTGESKIFATRVIHSADQDEFIEKMVEDIDSKTWPAYLQKAWINHIIDNDNFSEKYVAAQVVDAGLSAKKAYLSIQKIPKSHEKMVRSWLSEPSYELQELALLKLFTSFRDNGDDYLKMTKDVKGTRGNNVKVMWEFVNLINSKGAGSVDEIISMTSAQYDFLTRMKSLEVIDALGFPDVSNELLVNCFQGVFQGNRRWRGSAITFLRKSNEDALKQKTILAFIDAHKSDWQDWQKLRVENVFSIKIEE